MMGFQISGEVLDSYLSLDNPPYKGMEVLLMTDKTILSAGISVHRNGL